MTEDKMTQPQETPEKLSNPGRRRLLQGAAVLPMAAALPTTPEVAPTVLTGVQFVERARRWVGWFEGVSPIAFIENVVRAAKGGDIRSYVSVFEDPTKVIQGAHAPTINDMFDILNSVEYAEIPIGEITDPEFLQLLAQFTDEADVSSGDLEVFMDALQQLGLTPRGTIGEIGDALRGSLVQRAEAALEYVGNLKGVAESWEERQILQALQDVQMNLADDSELLERLERAEKQVSGRLAEYLDAEHNQRLENEDKEYQRREDAREQERQQYERAEREMACFCTVHLLDIYDVQQVDPLGDLYIDGKPAPVWQLSPYRQYPDMTDSELTVGRGDFVNYIRKSHPEEAQSGNFRIREDGERGLLIAMRPSSPIYDIFKRNRDGRYIFRLPRVSSLDYENEVV